MVMLIIFSFIIAIASAKKYQELKSKNDSRAVLFLIIEILAICEMVILRF